MKRDLLAKELTARQASSADERRHPRLLAPANDYVYKVAPGSDGLPRTVHEVGCESVTGYTPADYEADPYLWYRMIYDEDRPAVMMQVSRILKGEQPIPLEHRIIHKDGGIRWVRNTPILQSNAQGGKVVYQAVVSDVTKRKQAEALMTVQCSVTRVLAESRTLGEAISKTIEAVCNTCGHASWDWAAFWQPDPKAHVLLCLETWHLPVAQTESFELKCQTLPLEADTSLPGRVWASGEPVWIADVDQDPGCQRITDACRFGFHGACAFPIRHGEVITGIVELMSRGVQQPNHDWLPILAAVGTELDQFIYRKQSEDALVAERNLLRTLINNLPDYIYVKDVQSRFVLNNRAHLEVLGAIQPQDALGKTDADFFPAELAARYRADEEALLKSGQPLLNREEPMIDCQGNRQRVLTTKVLLKDDQGRITGLVGVTRNITERLQEQMAVRESQERLALVIEGSRDGIWDWNLLTNEVYYSARWKSMLGYEDSELENHFSVWERLLHPEDRDRSLMAIHAYLTGQTPAFELEHRLRHKDGSYRWILARGVASRNDAGQPVRMAGSHVDLTERKAAEEKLRRAHDELAQSDENLKRALKELGDSHEELKATQFQLIQAAKLESIGTLAAGVAHEVKNPLQTVLMGLDYLSHNVAVDNENLALTLSDMRDAVTRANAIVGELLQLSAATKFNQKDEDLNALIERSFWLIQAELNNLQTTVVRQLAPGLPPVHVDRSKLEQVFINLFLNALQAMSHEGILSVATRLVRVEQPLQMQERIYSRFKPGDQVVVTEIQDTGPGIPDSNLSRIFDPFFTTKPVGIGTGLGLSVVKRIMDLHEGAIELKNCSPRGVKVTLVLKTKSEEYHDQKTHSNS